MFPMDSDCAIARHSLANRTSTIQPNWYFSPGRLRSWRTMMPIRRLGDPRSAPGRVGLKWLPQIVRGQRVPGRTRCTVFANPRAPVVPNRFEGGTGVGAMFGSSHTEPFRRYDWSPNGMFHKELFQQKRYTPECMKHGPRSNGTPGTRNKTGFPLQTSGFQGLMLVFSGVPHCNEHTCFFSKHWGGNMSNEHMFQTLVCVCVWRCGFGTFSNKTSCTYFPPLHPLKGQLPCLKMTCWLPA